MKKRFSILIMIIVAMSPIIAAEAISYIEGKGEIDDSTKAVTVRSVEEYFDGL